MYSTFKDVEKLLVRPPKVKDPRPDNFVFRLHYQYTFTVLIVSSILVTSYSYIDKKGSAIQCMADKSQVPGDILNTYCWISSTFTLPKHYTCEPGETCLSGGVGPEEEEDERVYHAYYQWVPFFLFFQAIMFYFPHWFWKQLEGGRFDCIIMGLNLEISSEDRDKKIEDLVKYMKERKKYSYEHQLWTFKFYLCELLNFVNVIFQMCLTDKFLGYSFSEYGLDVLSWPDQDPELRMDPMSRVFPRITKCRFEKFGGSGTIQNFDALCVLGMNIINEKIFVFLWFWFIVLAIITGVNLVYRAVTWFVPSVRSRLVILEEFGFRSQRPDQAERISLYLSETSHSDWLIIYYLAQSMDKGNFYEFILKMSGSGETHIADENDRDNERDDSTLPLKK